MSNEKDVKLYGQIKQDIQKIISTYVSKNVEIVAYRHIRQKVFGLC